MRPSTRRLPVALPVVAFVLVVSVGLALLVHDLRAADGERAPAPARSSAAGRQPTTSSAREVLRRWDVRRARAWADGDATALRDLYTPTSRAGRRDLMMLSRWTRRGLMVSWSTQVVSLRVVREEPRLLVLRVIDRVDAATTVVAGRAVVLPSDRSTRRRIELRRRPGEAWQVASVRAV